MYTLRVLLKLFDLKNRSFLNENFQRDYFNFSVYSEIMIQIFGRHFSSACIEFVVSLIFIRAPALPDESNGVSGLSTNFFPQIFYTRVVRSYVFYLIFSRHFGEKIVTATRFTNK